MSTINYVWERRWFEWSFHHLPNDSTSFLQEIQKSFVLRVACHCVPVEGTRDSASDYGTNRVLENERKGKGHDRIKWKEKYGTRVIARGREKRWGDDHVGANRTRRCTTSLCTYFPGVVDTDRCGDTQHACKNGVVCGRKFLLEVIRTVHLGKNMSSGNELIWSRAELPLKSDEPK